MAEPCATSSKISEESGENTGDKEIIPGYKDVTSFSGQMLTSVMGAIRSSNELPAEGDDFDYYNSFQTFRELMNIEGKRILQLMQTIMKYEGVKGNLQPDSEQKDAEDRFDVLVDVNDQLLERVGNFLDEASGIKKQETALVIASAAPKATPTNASWNKKVATPSREKKANFRLLAARFVQRPQLNFKDKIDNSNRPFFPKIREKPNALKPLDESIRLRVTADEIDDGDFSQDYPHPYGYEISRLEYKQVLLEKCVPRKPLPLADTPLTFVDKLSDLEKMVATLKNEFEIAVDLEHHSYRSYLGITCLIQISSRCHDWVIDALAVRSQLYLLNEVFTDPNIVKVLHGSDSDVDWLQRDFGVYLVNMFDTGQASRVLNMARFSLAHLMSHYCQVTADKQYQLADWRIRPLPEELVKYAREDTHYLLYIYDMMRNELIDKGNAQRNLLISVLDRSKQLCLKKYVKPVTGPDSHIPLYRKSRKVFNSQQMYAFQHLFAWRDKVARTEDESLGYVIPNHMLLHISELLPRESQGVLACCNPIPPFVRQYLSDIHQIILDAREITLVKLIPDKTAMRPTVLEHPKYNARSLLNCPHDLSHAKALLEEQNGPPKLGGYYRQNARGAEVIRANDVKEPWTSLIARAASRCLARHSALDPSLIATSSALFGSSKTISGGSVKTTLTAFSWKPSSLCGRSSSAQDQAKSILASFISPYDKVSRPQPTETWLKKPRLFATTIVEPKNTWGKRLKQIDDTWGTFIKMAAEKSKKVQESKEAPMEAEVNEDASLAQRFPKRKQKEEESPQDKKKKKKEKDRKEEIREDVSEKLKEFKAFDYSHSDFKIFEGSEKKKKSKEFNPSGKHNYKNPSKPKLKFPSGKKSGHLSGKSSGGGGHNWPKR